MTITLFNLATLVAQTAPPAAPPAGGDDRILMVWALIAFGIAIVLVILEAFLPSGGIMGGLAGVCAIVGIALFFGFDTTWGLVSMAFTFLSLPFILAGMIWIWPSTPIGRALTLKDEPRAENAGDNDGPAIEVGATGEALTDLRPVGACKLGGKRTDCFAIAGVIEKGSAVKVVGVEGSTIRVKATGN